MLDKIKQDDYAILLDVGNATDSVELSNKMESHDFWV